MLCICCHTSTGGIMTTALLFDFLNVSKLQLVAEESAIASATM